MYILVCIACDRRGLRPELVTKSSIQWTYDFDVAGGFAGWRPYDPPQPGSSDERDDFMFRAFKTGVSDAEAQGEWSQYKREIASQIDDRPLAKFIAQFDGSATA